MDIIDIILARALTPQGQIEQYAALANSAVSKANAAVANIETITSQTTENNEAAATALENATAALEAAQEAQSTIENVLEDVTDAIKEVDYEVTSTDSNNNVTNNLHLTYSDNTEETVPGLVKMYKEPGYNEDGTMTQRAITQYVGALEDEIVLLDNRITDIEDNGGGSGEGGGISNLGNDAAGYLVGINEDGDICQSTIKEEVLVNELTAHHATVEKQLDYFKSTQVIPAVCDAHVATVRTQLKNYERGRADNYLKYLDYVIYNKIFLIGVYTPL